MAQLTEWQHAFHRLLKSHKTTLHVQVYMLKPKNAHVQNMFYHILLNRHASITFPIIIIIALEEY